MDLPAEGVAHDHLSLLPAGGKEPTRLSTQKISTWVSSPARPDNRLMLRSVLGSLLATSLPIHLSFAFAKLRLNHPSRSLSIHVGFKLVAVFGLIVDDPMSRTFSALGSG